MARHKILKERSITARGIAAQLPRWTQMARTVPAIRIEKVEETRKAMEKNSLETDEALDITLDRLSEDLGLAEPDDGETFA